MRRRMRYRTQFCFIGPGALLDRYATASSTHLVLPQVTNEKYVEFYTRKRREGDFLILDNGAYEGVTNWTLLVDAIRRYNPQVVALPDFLLTDGKLTYEVAGDFLEKHREEFPNVRWMFVPQAEPGQFREWKGWMNKAIKAFKVEWIALPRALVTHIATGENAKFARIDICEELNLRGIKTHALGMANGNLWELDRLAWEGVCSLDNSSPIWRGVHRLHLDDASSHAWWDNHGTTVDFDFDEPLSPAQIHAIQCNINAVLQRCGRELVQWPTK